MAGVGWLVVMLRAFVQPRRADSPRWPVPMQDAVGPPEARGACADDGRRSRRLQTCEYCCGVEYTHLPGRDPWVLREVHGTSSCSPICGRAKHPPYICGHRRVTARQRARALQPPGKRRWPWCVARTQLLHARCACAKSFQQRARGKGPNPAALCVRGVHLRGPRCAAEESAPSHARHLRGLNPAIAVWPGGPDQS